MVKRKCRWKMLLLCLLTAAVCFALSLKFAGELLSLKQRIYQKITTVTAKEEPSAPETDFSDFAPRVYTGGEWFQKTNLISHACGGIDGITYTNSREALELALENGHRCIEVDFAFTTDEKLVCVHDWEQFGTMVPGQDWERQGSLQGCAYDYYQNLKICGRYSPLSAEELVAYMEQYPELYVMVDTKYDLQQVMTALVKLAPTDEIRNRLIIQVYAPGEKQAVRSIYPFPEENFLLTLYKLGIDAAEDILPICRDDNIPVVTAPLGSLSRKTLEELREKNLVIYEHTENRLDQARIVMDSGVRGVYTDFLTPDLFRDAN